MADLLANVGILILVSILIVWGSISAGIAYRRDDKVGAAAILAITFTVLWLAAANIRR